MRRKIIGIFVCMLMIITVFPVVGSPIQTSMVREHPEKREATMDDIVISMLEQVNETMYLRYLENLTAFGPRVTGTDACNASAEYIYNQFESMGLVVRYHHWEVGGYSSDNVEATIPGTGESSDEICIICAHYDTHYWTLDNSPLGVGADDDASGIVAVMMAAFIISQSHYRFNHTIKFMGFSGEEEGLFGSQVYAAEAADEGWNIVGVLNADMISYAVTTSDGNNLIVFEDDASEWLYNYTYDINNKYSDYIHLTLNHGGYTWGSDHNSFWDRGYNALFYFEYTETPYYHTSEDTIAHINATYAVKNIRLILATLAEMAQQPRPVLQITGISGGFGVTAYITNAGDETAADVTAKIRITGGLFGFVDKTSTDEITALNPEGSMQIKTMLFRFGRIYITATVGASNAGQTTKQATGFIIGPVVLDLVNLP